MLIGVTGYKRTGKDTTAGIICREYGYKQYSVAHKMKECLTIIFGWSLEFIENNKDTVDPEWSLSPRQALQSLGTEWGQHELCRAYPAFRDLIGRKIWVRSLLHSLDDYRFSVISDVRFPHEVEEIRKYRGKIVRVFGGYPGCPVPDLSHESESSIDLIEFDIGIANDGDLKDLESVVHCSVGYMLGV